MADPAAGVIWYLHVWVESHSSGDVSSRVSTGDGRGVSNWANPTEISGVNRNMSVRESNEREEEVKTRRPGKHDRGLLCNLLCNNR